MSDAARSPWRASELLFFALLALFVASHVWMLPSLQHLIDEGTNTYAARLIQRGQVPFRDFFYHQPPLYLYALALLPTDHFVYGRALSLLATCGSGRLIFQIARSLLPAGSLGALLPVALFYFAALQYYGMLALPNACMLCFALLGTWLAFQRRRPVAGAAALVVAVLFKPIAIPVIFAVLLALAVGRERRRETLPFASTIAVGGALSWLVLHWTSDGAFSDLLRLQAVRYADRSVLDVIRSLPLLRDTLRDTSSVRLNLVFHLDSFASADALLLLLLPPGLWTAWRRASRFGRADAVLWSAWLLLCVLSVIFVWDVSWQHYHLLYLPPLTLFVGVWLWQVARRGRAAQVAVVALCLVYAGSGLASLRSRWQDYSEVLALRGETAPLLTFDATLNVLSRTESPCGLLDYLGQSAPDFYGDAFARFGVSTTDIVHCLDASPEIRVVIHQLADTSFLFIDRRLYAAIRDLPPERVVYLGAGSREAFQALEGRL